MKKRTTQFQQHLFHDIEDEDKAQEYLNESLPLIGEVVMYFNWLEANLGSLVCEMISDRSDSPGLIVISKLSYGAKVDLFKRFCDDLHLTCDSNPDSYQGLVDSLNELANRRNLVVHADWASTDHEGYTFVRLKIVGGSMSQEYVQFSLESLETLISDLIHARERLSDYWEDRTTLLQR